MSRQIPKRAVTKKEDQTGAISQSVPANFGSSIHPPATPYIRPAFGDEKEVPPLTEEEMPDPSPGGNSILDTMSGSFSLKNDRGGFIPLATMSMPVRGAEFMRLGNDNGVEDLASNFRILSIIDESAETGKDDNPNKDVEEFGDDDGGDDEDGVFGMDMDD